MKGLCSYIFEKRRNPELNKKLPPIEQIKNYNDMPNSKQFFMSFTDIFKIGINPHSGYNTPIGIYTYPIDPAYMVYMKPKGTVKAVPFAGSSENIFVVKQNNKKGRFVMHMTKDYTVADYKKDLKWLRNTFGGIRDKSAIELGPDGVDEIEITIEAGEASARHNSPIGRMWNITRMISSNTLYSKYIKWFGKKSSVNWNVLWRKMGYSGFCDRGGYGIIHPAEKVQAVFFDKGAFDVVDHIWNVKYNESAERWWSNVAKLHRDGKIKKIIHLDGHKAVKHGSKPKPTMIDWDSPEFSWIFDADFTADKLYVSKRQLKLEGGTFNKGKIGGSLHRMNIKGGSIVGYDKTGSFDVTNMTITPTTNLLECKISGGMWNTCKIDDCDITGGNFIGSRIFGCKMRGKINITGGHINNSVVDGGSIIGSIVVETNINNCVVTGTEITYGSMKNTKYNKGDGFKMKEIRCDVEKCVINDAILFNSDVIDTRVTGKSVIRGCKYIIKNPSVKVFGSNPSFSGSLFTNSIWDAPLEAWKVGKEAWGNGNNIETSDLVSKTDTGRREFYPKEFAKYIESGESLKGYKDLVKQIQKGDI